MMNCYINAIEIIAPGIENWEQAQDFFSGSKHCEHNDFVLPKNNLLSAREQRRASPTVKLATATALQTVESSSYDASTLATVFASSTGESNALDHILDALDTEERFISPTQFHNSVHNTPAGYWHIAQKSTAPSTSLAAYDTTPAAALLKSCMQSCSEKRPVLLVIYDHPLPVPLHEKRPMDFPLGVGMIIDQVDQSASAQKIEITIEAQSNIVATGVQSEVVKSLSSGNPASSILPLLEALSQPKKTTDVLLECPIGANLHIKLV